MKKLINFMSIMLCSMMMATAFTACGGDDDGGSSSGGGGSTDNSTTKAKLVGKWQAIAAKGTFSRNGYNYKDINTKEIYGIDSLYSTPALIIINSDGKFESFHAELSNYKIINGTSYPFAYSWRKQGAYHGGDGEGTYTLEGNQIQLNDNAGSPFSIKATINSLTNDRLILHIVSEDDEGKCHENVIVTYGRDGDGVEYFTYPYLNWN